MYTRTYRRLFNEFNSEEAVKLYPNVVETLKTLHTKGIILTIASSRSHTSLAEYVESRGLSSLISYILGADDVHKGKPDPEPVNRTLQRFGIHPDEAIVVGDTSFDIQMGKNSGTRTPQEFSEGHIPGAVNIDLDREDFFEQMDCLDKDKPVAVYCRGGRRSKIAAERFVGKGFEVTELDGGIITWEGEIEK